MRDCASEKRKSLGQIFTPPEIADFLVNWAVRNGSDRILEPSCGEGVFLRAIIKRLLDLGADIERIPEQVWGVEIDTNALQVARRNLIEEFGLSPRLIHSDFFEIRPRPIFDPIVGNPPYIRYHLFTGRVRERALAASRAAGVELNELTSSWAPFVIHAGQFLNDGGRMAIVLPSKLLYADYAKPVRKWLLDNFQSITIISFEERVFEGIEEGTVLLLADKSGERGVRFVEVPSARELESFTGSAPIMDPKPNEKWTKYLLPHDLLTRFTEVLGKLKDSVIPLGEFARVTTGVLTGYDEFFTLTENEVKEWGIDEKYLVPVITESRSMNGVTITTADWKSIRKRGRKCYLLLVDDPLENIDENTRKYLVERGAELNVMSRYKVRKRSPWYRVPGVASPEIFLGYMVYDIPKFTVNEVVWQSKRATSTNTIHRVFLRQNVDPLLLAAGFYNSLTMASTELTGRFYGGGVLKLEIKDSMRILVPKPIVSALGKEVAERVDRLMRKRRVPDAISIIDEIILEGELGLGNAEIETLSEIRRYLARRRLGREPC